MRFTGTVTLYFIFIFVLREVTSQDETASQTSTIDQMTTPNQLNENKTSAAFDTTTLVNLVDINASPIVTSTTPQDDSTVQIMIIEPVVDSLSSTTNKIVNNLSNQIRNILQHFGEPEPIGFPNQTILPDSLDVPNVTQDLGIGTGQYYNMTVYGLANFTVESINMLLDQLEVYVKVHMKTINVRGNCTLSSMFFSTSGPFNLTARNVTAEGRVNLVVSSDGTVRANNSATEITYERLNFQLGTNSSNPFQAVLSAAGIALVSAIKPHIQQRIDESLVIEVNRQLEQSPKLVAISKLSPVDLAIIEGRQYVRRKYDPYVIENVFNYDSEYLTVKLGPVTVRGLSRFTRIGNVKFGLVNRTMIVKMHLLTGRLSGDVKFEFNFGKVGPGRIGESKFSVHHLQFEAVIKQPLNLGKKPILDDLQLEVGKINVQMDGKGRFDYMLELVMQFLPNVLRHFIIDALEEPLKQRIQSDILDKVDAEKLIFENLPLLEKLFFKDT